MERANLSGNAVTFELETKVGLSRLAVEYFISRAMNRPARAARFPDLDDLRRSARRLCDHGRAHDGVSTAATGWSRTRAHTSTARSVRADCSSICPVRTRTPCTVAPRRRSIEPRKHGPGALIAT